MRVHSDAQLCVTDARRTVGRFHLWPPFNETVVCGKGANRGWLSSSLLLLFLSRCAKWPSTTCSVSAETCIFCTPDGRTGSGVFSCKSLLLYKDLWCKTKLFPPCCGTCITNCTYVPPLKQNKTKNNHLARIGMTRSISVFTDAVHERVYLVYIVRCNGSIFWLVIGYINLQL